MTFLIGSFAFILGAIFASFAGVLAGRLYTGQGILLGRSACDRCGTVLQGASLVPILSYFFSQGRARCCGARISLFSPLSELVVGGLFLLSYLALGLSAALLLMLISLTLLTALVLYDLAHHILPPRLLVLFCASSIGFALLNEGALLVSFEVALAIATFFALLWGLSGGRAMGLADAPLAFGLALLAGPVAFSGLLFSFWIGAVVGIVLLEWGGTGATMKSEVPFAPFLAAGFLLAYFTQWDPFSFSALLTALLHGGLP